MRFAVSSGLICMLFFGAVHCFGDVDVDEMSMAMVEAMGAFSEATGRALQGLGGMTKGMPAGSLKKNAFGRHMLQNQGALCAWENDRCRLSDTAIERITAASTSPTAAYAEKFLSCTGPKDAKICHENGCTWSHGSCSPSLLGNSDYNKCAGELSPVLKSAMINEKCLSHYSTEAECSAQDECIWYSKDCRGDEWKIFLGIPTQSDGQPVGSTEAVEQRANELRELVSSSNELFEMDPSDIFTWVAPKIQCPAGVDERVCKYAQFGVDAGFRAGFYCSRKYKGPGPMCDEDPICISQDSKCGVQESVILKGARNSIKILIFAIPNQKLQEVVFPLVQCPENSQSTCSAPCAWNDRDSHCFASDIWIYEQLAKEIKVSADPTCEPVFALLTAGCAGLNDRGCFANSKCSWYTVEGKCFLSDKEMMKMFAESDPGLSELQTSWEECTGYKTQIECALLL